MATGWQDAKRALEGARHREDDERERIETQLRVAEALTELHPEKAGDWRELIRRATDVVAAAAGSGADGLREAVRRAEGILTPLSATAKSYSVYCVGHAHIDMNWQWSWPETVAVTHDSFRTVLRLMEEFPEFRFSQSQASVYRIIEEHNPDMLAEIADRVREGRWEVTASHWVEGEKNIVSGESLTRHLLYTRRYLAKLFGLTPEDVPIDWSPDTFGHAVTVPSYLVRGGVRYLYLHRPGTRGPKRPRAFRWRAPDGSEVLVKNDMECGYNGQINPAVADLLLRFVRETGLPFTIFVYGVGDHGGGPTRRDLLRCLDMNTWPVFPELRFATAREFFERLDREGTALPVLDCELNDEFTGCYTTQTLIKRANRLAQNRLADAEAAAVAAHLATGFPYPAAALEQGWRDTLFNHFHDILPGSGVHDTRTYTHGLFQQTMAATGMIETRALRAIAAVVRTGTPPAADPDASPNEPTALGSGAGFGSAEGGLTHADLSSGSGERPFLFFNPLGHERSELAEVTLWDDASRAEAAKWRPEGLAAAVFSAVAPDGTTVPAQNLGAGHYWGHAFVRLAFPVTVPGTGYAVYTVVERPAPAPQPSPVRQLGLEHHCSYSRWERSPEGLENEHLRLEVDPNTGGILRLTHTSSGLEIVAPGPGHSLLKYALERPHGMTAWLIDHTGPTTQPAVTHIRRGPAGPCKATLEVGLRVAASDFTLTYELRAGDPALYLHLAGTWFERGTPATGIPSLSLSLPTALSGAKARYEIPFGAIDRDTVGGEEVPALQWAEVAGTCDGESAGIVLFNDSKHGHSLAGNVLDLTLIRSSYDPDPLPEIGRHEVRLALRPFAGARPEAAELIRSADAFNRPLRVQGTDLHEGTLPPTGRFLEIAGPNAVLCGLKKAEDSDAVVVRVFNPNAAGGPVTVSFPGSAPGKLARIDLLERPVAGDGGTGVASRNSVDLPPGCIESLSLKP